MRSWNTPTPLLINMKILLSLILLFYLTPTTVFSQPWERIIGVQNRPEAFQNFSESYDQGFLLLGIKEFYPDTKGYIIKTDVNGYPLYEIILGINNEQRNLPQYVASTNDGGLIICGAHENWEIGDVGVVKLNACGNLEWCNIWRTDNLTDWGKEIHQLADGGYIMLVQQNNDDSSNVWLYRLDNIGNPLWRQSYANYSQYPVHPSVMDDLHQVTGDNFLLSGACWWCDSTEWCDLKAMAIQVDSSGIEEWVSAFMPLTPNYYTSGNNGTQMGSGNYYIGAGNPTEGPLLVEYPPMLIVMDSLGNFLRDTLPQIPDIGDYYASGYLLDLIFTPEGKLFSHTDMENDPDDYIGHFSLHELDSLGGWHNSFLRLNAHSYRSKTILTSDGKILAGSVVGATAQEQDIILMKFNTALQYDSIYTVPRVYDYMCSEPIVSKTIDLDCEVIVDVKDIPSREDYYRSIKQIPVTPMPNPASGVVKFALKNTEHHKNIRIICYDLFGRQLEILPVNSGISDVSLDISGWNPGMYMSVVYAGNRQVGSTRFIVQ